MPAVNFLASIEAYLKRVSPKVLARRERVYAHRGLNPDFSYKSGWNGRSISDDLGIVQNNIVNWDIKVGRIAYLYVTDPIFRSKVDGNRGEFENFLSGVIAIEQSYAYGVREWGSVMWTRAGHREISSTVSEEVSIGGPQQSRMLVTQKIEQSLDNDMVSANRLLEFANSLRAVAISLADGHKFRAELLERVKTLEDEKVKLETRLSELDSGASAKVKDLEVTLETARAQNKRLESDVEEYIALAEVEQARADAVSRELSEMRGSLARALGVSDLEILRHLGTEATVYEEVSLPTVNGREIHELDSVFPKVAGAWANSAPVELSKRLLKQYKKNKTLQEVVLKAVKLLARYGPDYSGLSSTYIDVGRVVPDRLRYVPGRTALIRVNRTYRLVWARDGNGPVQIVEFGHHKDYWDSEA
jgi:hypothetical protein